MVNPTWSKAGWGQRGPLVTIPEKAARASFAQGEA